MMACLEFFLREKTVVLSTGGGEGRDNRTAVVSNVNHKVLLRESCIKELVTAILLRSMILMCMQIQLPDIFW